MRRFAFIAIVLIILGALAGGLDAVRSSQGGERAAPRLSYATTIVMVDGTELTLEVADTPKLRSLGLSGREGLRPGTGMLFEFDRAGLHGIWMKDMRFAIDIAWLDKDLCIISITSRVAPETYPTVFVPERPSVYVIETSAGFFRSHNLAKGDCLSAPEAE